MKRSRLLPGVLGLALCAIACPQKEAPPPPPPAAPPPPATPPPPAETPPAAAAGPGGISGVVAFEGAAPAPTKLDMKKDPSCAKANKDGTVAEVAVKDGKLADVFVWIKEGLPEDATFPVRSEPVVLDQQGCLYHPLVLAAQVGQKLTLKNSDATMHNVHGTPKRGEFNVAMPKKDSTLERTFAAQEIMFPIQCEVHSWMKAHMSVVKHPFFGVTGADGSFKLENVPSGKYTLELIHPVLGSQTQEVTVEAGKVAEAKASFKAKG